MTQPSIQYRALKRILESKDKDVQSALALRVISCAEAVLNRSGTYGRARGDIWLNDELWDIFMDEEFANYYDLLLQHEGNADDECQLLANYWIMTLANTGQPRYLPIIKHLAEVNCYGL
jgi:hypothetical protein